MNEDELNALWQQSQQNHKNINHLFSIAKNQEIFNLMVLIVLIILTLGEIILYA
jgi:hypothetical protein